MTTITTTQYPSSLSSALRKESDTNPSLNTSLPTKSAALPPQQDATQTLLQQAPMQKMHRKNVESTSDFLRRHARKQSESNPQATGNPASFAALPFSALTLAQTKQEAALSFLLQIEQKRTGKSAEEIESTVGQPMRTFLTELAKIYPLGKDTQTAYLSPPPELNTKLFVLRALEEAIGKLNTADLASPIVNQKLNDTYSQHRNLIDKANNDVPNDMDVYANMALDRYLGQQASGLNTWIDWGKAKTQISTPSQAVALMGGALSNNDLAQKVGRGLANASSESAREIFAKLSSDEKATLDRAALLYYTARDPSFSPAGKDLPVLRQNFASLLRETYQKSLIFFSPMDTALASTQSDARNEVVARLQTRGITPDQLVNDPYLQSSVPGFSKLRREDQIRLVNERLIEQGQSTDPRYKMGSTEHAMASTLIQTLQMQGQAVPKDFGSKEALAKQFFDASKTWQTTPNSSVHPFVLFSLNLARASGEDKAVIGTGTDASQKIKNLINYGKERLVMFPQPAKFDRKAAALEILHDETGWSKEKLSGERMEFSDKDYSDPYYETPLDHFFRHARDSGNPFASSPGPMHIAGRFFHPHEPLQAKEVKYNQQLFKDPWIIATAKENLRAQGLYALPLDSEQTNRLNAEISKVAGSHATKTEDSQFWQRFLHSFEASVPVLGQAVEVIDGLATQNLDKIFSPIPFVGGAYNLVQGIRLGDPGRAIGGSVQFALDVGLTLVGGVGGGGVGRVAGKEVEGAIEGTVTRLEAEQLPSRLAANLSASATLAESLGEKLEIKLPEINMAGAALETPGAEGIHPSELFNVAKSGTEIQSDLNRQFAAMQRRFPEQTVMEVFYPPLGRKMLLTEIEDKVVLLDYRQTNSAGVIDPQTGRLLRQAYRQSNNDPWGYVGLNGGAPLAMATEKPLVLKEVNPNDRIFVDLKKSSGQEITFPSMKLIPITQAPAAQIPLIRDTERIYADMVKIIKEGNREVRQRNAAAAGYLVDRGPDGTSVSKTYQSVSGQSPNPYLTKIETQTSVGTDEARNRFPAYTHSKHPAALDSERKLFLKIAEDLDPTMTYSPQNPATSFTGNLVVRTHLPMCQACQAVQTLFQETFPNIHISVVEGVGDVSTLTPPATP